MTSNTNENEVQTRKAFKPLPAPFHVKGRRPSTGVNKMDNIREE